MKIDVRINPIPKSAEDKDMYMLKMSTYKETIEGKFEKSELRQLIQIIDNAIL